MKNNLSPLLTSFFFSFLAGLLTHDVSIWPPSTKAMFIIADVMVVC